MVALVFALCTAVGGAFFASSVFADEGQTSFQLILDNGAEEY
jgi:hypothetical protein